MNSLTLSQAEAALWLGLEKTAISAADLLICLFKGNLTPTPTTPLTDLTAAEPTGSWYTPIAGVVGDPFLNPDGSLEFALESVQFDYTGTDPAEVITGFFVITAATPRLVGAGLLPLGKTMGTTLDALIVQPTLSLPPILAA